MDSHGITEELEAMVDKHGLTHVLIGIACICNEKAEHLRANWQDNITARSWTQDARTIEKAAAKVNN